MSDRPDPVDAIRADDVLRSWLDHQLMDADERRLYHIDVPLGLFRQILARLDRSEAEVARLREALRDCAEELQAWKDMNPPGAAPVKPLVTSVVLRNARAALASHPTEGVR